MKLDIFSEPIAERSLIDSLRVSDIKYFLKYHIAIMVNEVNTFFLIDKIPKIKILFHYFYRNL